jgi:hypothetical protein
LPVGGILTELRLPTTVKKLTIDTHRQLTAENFSIGGYSYGEGNSLIGGVGGQYLNDYTALTDLKIIDTPIDTYAMVRGARNLENYCLRGVTWVATENDSQYCLRLNDENLDATKIKDYFVYDPERKAYVQWGKDTYPTDGSMLYERMTMIQNGEVVCIPVLEYLKTKNYLDSTKPAEALTGTLTLKLGDVRVNELAIYQKYVDIYPDLQILYEDMPNVEGAKRINFYYADKDSINEEDGVKDLIPYFSKMTANQQSSLADLINNNGFTVPNKSPTSMKTYTFTGKWTDWNTKIVYYQDEYFDKVKNDAFESFGEVVETVKSSDVSLDDYMDMSLD